MKWKKYIKKVRKAIKNYESKPMRVEHFGDEIIVHATDGLIPQTEKEKKKEYEKIIKSARTLED